MERACLNCGETFSGRRDKKFCSDYCRSAYNYTSKSENYKYVKRVNRILRKNLQILYELNPKGKSKAKRSKMIEMGFNFSFHTNIYTTKNGVTYYYVYDKGYIPIENDYVALIDKPDYIE